MTAVSHRIVFHMSYSLCTLSTLYHPQFTYFHLHYCVFSWASSTDAYTKRSH